MWTRIKVADADGAEVDGVAGVRGDQLTRPHDDPAGLPGEVDPDFEANRTGAEPGNLDLILGGRGRVLDREEFGVPHADQGEREELFHIDDGSPVRQQKTF